MKDLKKFLKRRMGLTLLTICISSASTFLYLWWTMSLKSVIDTITGGNAISKDVILHVTFIMVACAVFSYISSLCSSWSCETLLHDLRMNYAGYFASLSLSEIENLNPGQHVSRLQNEIGEISVFLQSNLFLTVDDIIKFTASASLMIFYNLKLTLIYIAPVILLLWYVAWSSKLINETASQRQQANSEMNGFADSLIAVFPALKIFNIEALFVERYNNSLKNWEYASAKEQRRRAKLMSLSGILTCIPLTLLILAGGIQVMRGNTTVGMLYVFFNLSANVSGVLTNMPGRINSFRDFSANMKRLAPYLNLNKKPE